MKKVILVITLLSVVVLVSTSAKRKEGSCELNKQQVDVTESTIYCASQYKSKLSEKPAQLKDLPKKASNRINYFLAEIAGREVPMIIDRGRNSKLYLDTDADGCLSDEKGFTPKKGYKPKTIKKRLFGPVDYHKFGPISVKFEQAAEKYAQQIYVFTRDSYMRRLILCPAVYRKGKVLLDNNIYEVSVIDGNFDGKYDKIFSPPVERLYALGHDLFAIDLNHNSKLDFNYYNQSELMPLGRMLKFRNSYYVIKISESGESLELNKIQPDYGSLNFGNVRVKLKLWSDAAQQFFSNIKNNVKIPVGKYQALFVELSQIDSERNTWDFTCYWNTGILGDFEISKNQTTSFEIGPPFKIETTSRKIRDRINIDFKLVGQASEKYRPDFKRNGRRVSQPVLRIIDEDSNVIHSGRFKYG